MAKNWSNFAIIGLILSLVMITSFFIFLSLAPSNKEIAGSLSHVIRQNFEDAFFISFLLIEICAICFCSMGLKEKGKKKYLAAVGLILAIILLLLTINGLVVMLT